jgi:hypothetical protein
MAWAAAAVTAGIGRPALAAGEAELLHEGGVRLYDGDAAAPGRDDGTLTLTSHRLLWVVRCLRSP